MIYALAILVCTARADMGPPPCCDEGTHTEYCEGNHCVPDGYQFDSACEEVEDSDAPSDYGDQECSSCGCASNPGGALGLGMVALAGAATLRRRR